MAYFEFENDVTPINDTNLNNMQRGLLELVFPIGSTYITQSNTNPNSILRFGTWERVRGRVLVGLDENDSNFNTIGKTGGAKEKQFKLPIGGDNAQGNVQHFSWNGGNYGVANEVVQSPNRYDLNGTPQAIAYSYQPLLTSEESILNPYQVVGYMWRRTA